MSTQKFDTFIIGQPSLDINTDYDGTTISAYGGAVVYSGFAAGALGHPTAVLPKADLVKTDVGALFADAKNVTVFPVRMCITPQTASAAPARQSPASILTWFRKYRTSTRKSITSQGLCTVISARKS